MSTHFWINNGSIVCVWTDITVHLECINEHQMYHFQNFRESNSMFRTCMVPTTHQCWTLWREPFWRFENWGFKKKILLNLNRVFQSGASRISILPLASADVKASCPCKDIVHLQFHTRSRILKPISIVCYESKLV